MSASQPSHLLMFDIFCWRLQVGRDFSPDVHNPLQGMVIDRVKYQLGYPESAKDMISTKSLLTAVEQYSMGSERTLSQYMKMVGLDMNTKEITLTKWCTDGTVSGFWILSSLLSLQALLYSLVSITSNIFLTFLLLVEFMNCCFSAPVSLLLVLNNLAISINNTIETCAVPFFLTQINHTFCNLSSS